jgi:adenosylcobinamide-GDP ribazoletransferase
MRLFFIAFQFLTIIPLPFSLQWRDEREVGRAMTVFPLVGLTLGGLLAALDLLLTPRLPAGLAAALLLLTLTAITGALHLDGVADVCDGLAARGDRERFLAVMKDSRTGAVGVVGLVLLLLLKWQAIVLLPGQFRWQGLVLAPALGRLAMVAVAANARRARTDGLGAACVAGAGWPQLTLALVLAGGSALVLTGRPGIVALALTLAMGLGFRTYFHRRLGGVTGDIIGCAGELAEITALVVFVVLGVSP